MTEEKSNKTTPSTITAALRSFISPSKPPRKSISATPPPPPPTTPTNKNSTQNQSSPSTSRSSSLLLVAGLLLSSSTSIIVPNSPAKRVSSRGMSPLRPRRIIQFESHFNQKITKEDQDELVDDSEDEEDDDEKNQQGQYEQDDSSLKEWLERLSKISEREEEKLVREADTFFSDTSMSSTSGVYLIEDQLGAVGVYKPRREECAKHEGQLREGLKAGDGALREVAAYVLDRTAGQCRAGVPATVMYKNGSLQRFVQHKCDADDVGTRLFDTDNVHHIGLLDLRIFNVDRHGGNMLFDEGTNRLVPIDHGLSLPPLNYLGEAEFGWMTWRQAKCPFSLKVLSFLRDELDIKRDVRVLREIGVEESSIATMCVSSSVLQHCALKLGMTLHDIGSIFVRRNRESPSVLERAVSDAMRTYDVASASPMTLAREVVLHVDSELRRLRKTRFLEEFQKGTSTSSLWRKLGPAVTP